MILVTCTCCDIDNRVDPKTMVVRFSEDPDEHAAELVFACAACGGSPLVRVPKELGAVVVLRGAASLTSPDLRLTAQAVSPPGVPPAALTPDDLLELHLQLQDGDILRRLFDDRGLDDA